MDITIDIDNKIDSSYKWSKGVIISDDLDMIREHFSVENVGANIGRYRRYKKISSIRKHAITATGKFKIGLYKEILKYLTTLGIPINLTITEDFLKSAKPTLNIKDLSPLIPTLYPYQDKSIRKALEQGCGIFEIGTGGGKTLTMCALMKTIQDNMGVENWKTAIIVPTLQLVEQTYEDFISYGIPKEDICKYSGNNKLDPNAKVFVVGTSILNSKARDNSWLGDIGTIIVDECHGLKHGNELTKKIEDVKTLYRFGFTGSLPEDDIDYWTMVGTIGPLIYTKKSKELRDEKYLTNALVCLLSLNHKQGPDFSKIDKLPKKERDKLPPQLRWEIENEFLINDEWRNNVIATLCSNINQNTLIMVDRINYGELLYDVISKKLPQREVYFIQGSVAVEARERVRNLMEEKDNIICIAISRIFSTGINIKNLPYIIFALIGKAKAKIIQSVGRGLRKHENKNKLTILDLSDNFEYSQRHLDKRKQLYQKEQLDYIEKEIYKG